ncbi:MAG: FprA family A-type flavoprotein [Chloroflexota bacterium]
MKAREIVPGVQLIGAIDWDRRLFDSLIPLPDGTSYNSYLVRGSTATALLDTVEPAKAATLLRQLADVPRLDYIVAHHAEQDHSGTLPRLLALYPEAKVLCSAKCQSLLVDHLSLDPERMVAMADGQTVSLGDKTLQFIHTPWQHWPETMVTYLPEDKILFSCDLFGSHLATSTMYADEASVYGPAKRYYAEIMMPFHVVIQRNLEKIGAYEVNFICPSHGPLYREPSFIRPAYQEWLSGPPRNLAVVPYVSMHDSTKLMVDHFVESLISRGVDVVQHNLVDGDLGRLAMSLVDASTVVLGTPTVLGGPHPAAVYGAFLANSLRPKVRYLSVIGSYGWGGKTVEMLTGMLGNLKAEVLPPVMVKGLPKAADFAALDRLADEIAAKHAEAATVATV